MPTNFTICMDVRSSDGDIGEAVNKKIEEIYGDYRYGDLLEFRIRIDVTKIQDPRAMPNINEAGRTIDSAMDAYEKMFGNASRIPDRYIDPNKFPPKE